MVWCLYLRQVVTSLILLGPDLELSDATRHRKALFSSRPYQFMSASPYGNHLQPGGVNQAESLLEINMFKTVTVAASLVVSPALSACASRRGNAAPAGAAAGAGGGSLLGAVAGFNPLIGATVGGAGGAVIGAATH
jgi:hypothetical protein